MDLGSENYPDIKVALTSKKNAAERLFRVRLTLRRDEKKELKYWMAQSMILASKVLVCPFIRYDASTVYQ